MNVKHVKDVIRDAGAFMGVVATQVDFANADSDKAYTKQSAVQLAESICNTHKASIVILSGSEPCAQEDLAELVDQLLIRKKYIIVDTNGTLEVPHGIHWTSVLPKAESNYRIDVLCKPDELKYIVNDNFDVDKAIPDTIRDLYAGKIWLFPDDSEPTQLKIWHKMVDIVRKDPRLRVGIQVHAYVKEVEE